MTYHDPIITITPCRGQIACALGESGRRVKNWSKLVKALEAELVRETPSRDDGHSGSCAVADLLLDRLRDEGRLESAGVEWKSENARGSRAECWPFEEPWFSGREVGV